MTAHVMLVTISQPATLWYQEFSRSLFREEKFQVKPLGPGYRPTRYSSTFIITEMSLPFSLAKNESYSTTVPTSNNMDCPICNY